MLSRGITECSDSPWASPVGLVRKIRRQGFVWTVVNLMTAHARMPTIDALGGACFFSTPDLASGYWQVVMDPKSKENTAFVTTYGLY